MSKIKLAHIIFIVCAILFFFVGYKLREYTYRPEPTIITKTDTVTVPQVITVYEPKVVDRWLVRVDTMFINTTDSIFIPVQIPIEKVVYRDTSYRAVVSGYKPKLDTLEIYTSKEYITIHTEKIVEKKIKSRFGIGVNAGYGITTAGLNPYVGVGVTYNILSF